MASPTLDRHITASPDVRGGKPHIVGRRITVADIAIWHEWLGQSADAIATEYDLALADIYAALAYYHDHREAIDQSLRESQAFVEALKTQVRSKLPASS